MARKKSATKKQKNSVTMLQIVPKKRRGGDNAKTSKTRADFLHAFEETFGNISASCEYAGIARLTFYRWMKSESRINKKFQAKIALLQPVERQLDFLEGMLMKRAAAGDTTAIIYGLKTKGIKRGYGERVNDIEYQLVLRAVLRIENIVNQQLSRDANFKPDVKRFAELAAADFGVKPEDVEKEFLKRQPQIFEQIQ